MDRTDLSVFPLIVDKKMVAFVDYQVCQSCGFRLMRVETTLINDQRIVARHCPICQQPDNPHQAAISEEDCLQNFDAWLAIHGLDRGILEKHYHLKVADFFDEID